MSRTILQTCGNCQKEFGCLKSEYNRHTKRGRSVFFCSRSCTRTYLNKNMPEETRLKISKNLKRGRKQIGNTNAKKGDFTFYLNKAKNRHFEFDIDEDHLSQIWTGKCSLSGIDIMMKNRNVKSTLTTASLDRIDSSLGYIKGNVQFVAYGLNLVKNAFSNDDVLRLISEIREHRHLANSSLMVSASST